MEKVNLCFRQIIKKYSLVFSFSLPMNYRLITHVVRGQITKYQLTTEKAGVN